MIVAANLDLTRHELRNAILQILAADPSTAAEALFYYNNVSKTVRYYNGTSWVDIGGGTGVTDHGALSGLADDDHTQYYNSTRIATWLAGLTTDDLAEGTTNLYFTSALNNKLALITVTQAVDLDQMESDIAALANGMVYKDEWDASAGTFPGGGDAQIGWFYSVSGAGTVDGVEFAVGDSIIAKADNASTTTYADNWVKKDSTDAVTSVAGRTGNITLTADDVSESTDKNYVTDAQVTLLEGIKGKFSANITGDNTTTAFVVTHNFDTRDLNVQVYDGDTYETILVDVQRNTVNQITVTFGTAPATSKVYRVVITG